MPKTPKAVKREAVFLWRYARATSAARKILLSGITAVAVAIGLLKSFGVDMSAQILPLLPPVIAKWSTPNRLSALAFVVIIFLAQYVAWRSATIKLIKLQKEKTKMFIEAELDFKFGPSSCMSPSELFDAASARLEQLEKEVNAGDFSNSAEVAFFKTAFIPILRSWFGGGAGFPMWYERLTKLVEAVSDMKGKWRLTIGNSLFYARCAALSKSPKLQGFRAIPAAIAGVMRMLLCIRQKL